MQKFLVAMTFAVLSSLGGYAAAAETSEAPAEATTPAVTSIDLNSADAQMLQDGLLGVGEVKARAIVDYRSEHGPFASVDELLEVKGIGSSILERNRERLVVR